MDFTAKAAEREADPPLPSFPPSGGSTVQFPSCADDQILRTDSDDVRRRRRVVVVNPVSTQREYEASPF